ncbi:hypothetical protein F4808DRAFT_443143 [Astrocystis sublimbata]|nr:hypothetical protein F4808DRAFT_443143 [Astrocystis sublimbata]
MTTKTHNHRPTSKMGVEATAVISGAFLSGKTTLEFLLLCIKDFRIATNTNTNTKNPGAMAGISMITVPVLLDTHTNPSTNTSPSHLLQQWARTYHYGHIIMPAICVGTCGMYIYASYSTHSTPSISTPSKSEQQQNQQVDENQQENGNESPSRSRLYALAAFATIAMVPFTWLAMVPTNEALFALLADAQAEALSASGGSDGLSASGTGTGLGSAGSALGSASILTSGSAGSAGESDVLFNTAQTLLTRWAWLHVARSVFPLVGAVLGLRAVLEKGRGQGRGIVSLRAETEK